MVAQPKEDPQAGMFDVEIDDEDYEAAIREWISLKDSRKTLSAIKRRMKEGEERNNVKSLEDGTRLRIGDFAAEIHTRQGGGFEIAEWETRSVANVRSRLGTVE